MKAKDIMTQNPKCCTPETSLQTVARLMCDCICGEIPVVESEQTMKPIGVITDRDITCRTVAQGKNPLQMKVQDCMTKPAITVSPEASLQECCQIMERKHIRRVPVVDQTGRCCGIVAQADVAKHASEHEIAECLKELSEPTGTPSLAAA
jgi:CBS domain-containing protein